MVMGWVWYQDGFVGADGASADHEGDVGEERVVHHRPHVRLQRIAHRSPAALRRLLLRLLFLRPLLLPLLLVLLSARVGAVGEQTRERPRDQGRQRLVVLRRRRLWAAVALLRQRLGLGRWAVGGLPSLPQPPAQLTPPRRGRRWLGGRRGLALVSSGRVVDDVGRSVDGVVVGGGGGVEGGGDGGRHLLESGEVGLGGDELESGELRAAVEAAQEPPEERPRHARRQLHLQHRPFPHFTAVGLGPPLGDQSPEKGRAGQHACADVSTRRRREKRRRGVGWYSGGRGRGSCRRWRWW